MPTVAVPRKPNPCVHCGKRPTIDQSENVLNIRCLQFCYESEDVCIHRTGKLLKDCNQLIEQWNQDNPL